jgi:hypothetical protein
MEIRRIAQFEAVEIAGHLFDAPPKEGATQRFLADERHHLLIAYVDGFPAGMITGVEMTHPDKGTEIVPLRARRGRVVPRTRCGEGVGFGAGGLGA